MSVTRVVSLATMRALVHAGCALLIIISACGRAPKSSRSLVLATTTSTRDSGLLDELLPRFEQQSGVDVKVVAVGTGQALEMARRGDADVLITHAPNAEEEFVAEGHGEMRLPFMASDFVLVGPPTDPAELKETAGIVSAFKRIRERQARFVSRGDRSGTNIKEQAIWKTAAITPSGHWYLECGSGMAATLRVASEKQAYTLSDRGTYLVHRDRLELAIVSEGDSRLLNPYAVIVVNREKHPDVNSESARTFADFLLSQETQRRIGSFGVARFGHPLFVPRRTERDDRGGRHP